MNKSKIDTMELINKLNWRYAAKAMNGEKVAEDKITDQNTRLTSAESTWQMAENLYRQLADQVREHDYDIKDLNR